MLSGSLWSRAATVVGLVGLACTQPVLDLMGQSPEFFIAGRYRPSQIIGFALFVAIVPASVLVAGVVLASWLHRPTGDVVYQLVLFVLGGVFGNVIAHALGFDRVLASVAFGLAVGAAALVLVRVRPGRMLLELLAAANVLFLVAFLVLSPTSQLLGRHDNTAGELGAISMPTPPGPVVVIVFDELPVTTLLDPQGRVNRERFPAFARLADVSTWYRNASSNHNRTEVAVPQVLTGSLAAADGLPSYLDLPRNLLTMFASEVPVHRYEAITDLCPPSLCETQAAEPLERALRDAAVVYGHRVLPARLRARLPAIDEGWGGFGETGGASIEEVERAVFERGRLARWHGKDEVEQSRASQAAILEQQIGAVGTEPALHLAHVIFPHSPWTLSPWGRALMTEEPPARARRHPDPAYERSSLLFYQRHALQVGAADVALGHILDHLEASPAWEDTTLVVVADHGTSTLTPDLGRAWTERNTQELLRIPLFIKGPGQTTGAMVDDVAQAIDVVPTIADLLDVELDWRFDGHSLVDGSSATAEPEVGEALDPLFEVIRRHHELVPSDGDWVSLAAVGEHAALVGQRLTDLTVGAPSALSFQPDFEHEFDSLPTDDGGMPRVLTGTVTSPHGARPPELVVSVNGRIAGTLGGYEEDGDRWRFATLLAPYLVDGVNEIHAYEVDGGVLRPLG